MKNYNLTSLIAALLLLAALPVAAQININIPTIEAEENETIYVDVTVEDFVDILSCQFSLHWDPTVIDFFNVTNLDGVDYLLQSSFNTTNTENGKFSLVWTDASTTVEGVTVDDGTLFFTMIFKVIGNGGTSTDITFEGDPTSIEIADNTGTVLTPEFQTGQINVSGTSAVGDYADNEVLVGFEARPNPIGTQGTTLYFDLASYSHTLLSIYSFDGTLLYEQNRTLGRGKQQVVLGPEVFPAAGIYLIELRSGNETIYEKIVKR